jgi:hypothetical protein
MALLPKVLLAWAAAGPAALCFAQAEPPVGKPTVKPGDFWIYRKMDYAANRPMETYELTVTFVRNDVIHASVYVEKGDPMGSFRSIAKPKTGDLDSDATFTSGWNALSAPDGSIREYRGEFLRFPLAPGNSFSYGYDIRRPRSGAFHVKHERTAAVTRWEDVVVPAGKFRALRVEANGSFQRQDQFMAGKARAVYWYAPEVKRWVKYTYETFVPQPWDHEGEELVAFKIH